MNLPLELLELSPIPDFLNYNYEYHESAEELYESVSRLVKPILIWKLKGLDHVCLAEDMHLCIDKKTYIVNFCVANKYQGSLPASLLDRYRFIVCVIHLKRTEDGKFTKENHSEAVIIDTLYHTIEFFEPYSSFAPRFAPPCGPLV